MPRRKPKCWRYAAGERPFTVEVREKRVGGPLHARAWDTVLRTTVSVPLGHRDQVAAKEYADRESKKLAAGPAKLAPSPTMGYILMQYLTHRTPRKSKPQHGEDRRRAELWRNVLGADRRVGSLGSAEWYSFIAERSTGAINARGIHVPEKKRAKVGERTVDGDLVFIVAVLNWATAWKVRGVPVIERNPWGGGAPGVKRSLERPKNLSPMRPLATYDRFLAVRAAADDVLMEARKGDPDAKLLEIGRAKYRLGERAVKKWMKQSFLPEILDLVEDTGRRITSICQLWYSDLVVRGGEVTKIRWRPFKGSKEQIVPLGDRGRAAARRVLSQRPGVGDAPVFPSLRSPAVSIGKRTATDWLIVAEQLAFKRKTIDVEHLAGGSFHPYRRKWATERKHHPDADVMAAGGWTDARSLKTSYQQSDDDTVLAVVNEPRKLIERKA